MKYDPDHDVDPKAWLALDESLRISAAETYHRNAKIKLPNVKVHAIMHAVVENQLALGQPDMVRYVFARLRSEGLTRHDAIHAIGSVVAGQMFSLLKEGQTPDNTPQAYAEKLGRLTAESWRQMEQD